MSDIINSRKSLVATFNSAPEIPTTREGIIDELGVSWLYCSIKNSDSDIVKADIPVHAIRFTSDDRLCVDTRTGKEMDAIELLQELFQVDEITAIESAKELLGALDGEKIAPAPEGQKSDNRADIEEELTTRFPIESLPPIMRDMIGAIRDVQNVSELLAAMCVMAAVSTSLGNKLAVHSVCSDTTYGNLYFFGGAKSGMGKSKAGRRALAPINALSAKLKKQWLAAQALTKPDDVSETSSCTPTLTVQNITSEELARTMSANGGPLALLATDGRGPLEVIMGKYTRGQNSDEQVYLNAYSVEPISYRRVGRDSVEVDAPCLTLLLLVQNDKFKEATAKENLADSGFLCRCLLCDTKADNGHTSAVWTMFPPAVEQRYTDLVQELTETFRLSTNPTVVIEAETGAREYITDYDNTSKDRMSESNYLQGFAARWAENAWRLVVVLHAAQHGKNAGVHSVSVETARNAVNIVSWFANEQENLMGEIEQQREDKKIEAILKRVQRMNGTTVRDLCRAKVVQNAAEGRALLEELVDTGRLKRSVESHPGGQVTKYYLPSKPKV